MLLSLAQSAHFTLQKLLSAVFVRIAVQVFSRGVFLLESCGTTAEPNVARCPSAAGRGALAGDSADLAGAPAGLRCG